MDEIIMPTTEVQGIGDEQELATYELAYHILPTVAEGEVPTVEAELTGLITKAHGVVTDTESAERFELAYDIQKYLEGKYRNFSSAYFGWIRFTLTPQALAGLTEGIDEHKQLLRYLMVRLTKVEEANPFRFHEALEASPLRTPKDDVAADISGIVEGEVADVDGVVDAPVEEEVVPVATA